MSFVTDWVQEKAAGYMRAGIEAGGTLAGNAVGGVGSLIENSGRAVGEGVNGSIRGVGSSINGYGDGIRASLAADGPVSSTQKKTAVKPTQPAKKAVSAAPKVADGPKPVVRPAGTGGAARPTSVKLGSGGAPRPAGTTRPVGSAGTRPSRSAGTGAKTGTKSVGQKPAGQKPMNGKVRISAESRPKPATKE